MIGKISKGSSFSGLVEYVLEKEKAELLATNMAGNTPAILTAQLTAVAARNSRVKLPVTHVSLSPHPDEKISSKQAIAIAKRYLEEMGYTNNQWIVAAHHDAYTDEGKPRYHLHLIINRVGITSAKTVPDNWEKIRAEVAIRKLETEFGLRSVQSSQSQEKLSPTTGQIRRQRQERATGATVIPSVLEQLQELLDKYLQESHSLNDYISNLKTEGVETRIRFNVEAAQIEGISCKYKQVALAGRKIGKKYTATSLEAMGLVTNNDLNSMKNKTCNDDNKDVKFPQFTPEILTKAELKPLIAIVTEKTVQASQKDDLDENKISEEDSESIVNSTTWEIDNQENEIKTNRPLDVEAVLIAAKKGSDDLQSSKDSEIIKVVQNEMMIEITKPLDKNIHRIDNIEVKEETYNINLEDRLEHDNRSQDQPNLFPKKAPIDDVFPEKSANNKMTTKEDTSHLNFSHQDRVKQLETEPKQPEKIKQQEVQRRKESAERTQKKRDLDWER